MLTANIAKLFIPIEICFADMILVMDEGEMKEYGTLSEIIERKGMFYKMYSSQQKMYLFSNTSL